MGSVGLKRVRERGPVRIWWQNNLLWLFERRKYFHLHQSIPLAPLEIRDAVFQELIRISPASNYMEELVTGPGGLLSRRLLEDHLTRYGALPRTKQERATLAVILNDCDASIRSDSRA